jgi:hypothetical protein
MIGGVIGVQNELASAVLRMHGPFAKASHWLGGRIA